MNHVLGWFMHHDIIHEHYKGFVLILRWNSIEPSVSNVTQGNKSKETQEDRFSFIARGTT